MLDPSAAGFGLRDVTPDLVDIGTGAAGARRIGQHRDSRVDAELGSGAG